MTFHGKDSSIKVDDSGGTLRDISPYVSNVAFARQNDNHDNTAFGAEGHTFINGLTNGTCTITGWTDVTALVGSMTVLNGLVGLDGTTSSIEYAPHGTATGALKYTCEAILKSLDVSDPVADLVAFTCVMQISGDVTTGVY